MVKSVRTQFIRFLNWKEPCLIHMKQDSWTFPDPQTWCPYLRRAAWILHCIHSVSVDIQREKSYLFYCPSKEVQSLPLCSGLLQKWKKALVKDADEFFSYCFQEPVRTERELRKKLLFLAEQLDFNQKIRRKRAWREHLERSWYETLDQWLFILLMPILFFYCLNCKPARREWAEAVLDSELQWFSWDDVYPDRSGLRRTYRWLQVEWIHKYFIQNPLKLSVEEQELLFLRERNWMRLWPSHAPRFKEEEILEEAYNLSRTQYQNVRDFLVLGAPESYYYFHFIRSALRGATQMALFWAGNCLDLGVYHSNFFKIFTNCMMDSDQAEVAAMILLDKLEETGYNRDLIYDLFRCLLELEDTHYEVIRSRCCALLERDFALFDRRQQLQILCSCSSYFFLQGAYQKALDYTLLYLEQVPLDRKMRLLKVILLAHLGKIKDAQEAFEQLAEPNEREIAFDYFFLVAYRYWELNLQTLSGEVVEQEGEEFWSVLRGWKGKEQDPRAFKMYCAFMKIILENNWTCLEEEVLESMKNLWPDSLRVALYRARRLLVDQEWTQLEELEEEFQKNCCREEHFFIFRLRLLLLQHQEEEARELLEELKERKNLSEELFSLYQGQIDGGNGREIEGDEDLYHQDPWLEFYAQLEEEAFPEPIRGKIVEPQSGSMSASTIFMQLHQLFSPFYKEFQRGKNSFEKKDQENPD